MDYLPRVRTYDLEEGDRVVDFCMDVYRRYMPREGDFGVENARMSP